VTPVALPADPTPTSYYSSPGIVSAGSAAPYMVQVTQSGADLGTGSTPYGITGFAPLYADGRSYAVHCRIVGGVAYVSVDNDKEHTGTPSVLSALTNTGFVGAGYTGTVCANVALGCIFMRKTAPSPTELSQAKAYVATKWGTSSYAGAKEVCFMGDSITAQAGNIAQWRGLTQATIDARPDGGAPFRPVGPLKPAFTPFARDRCLAGGGLTTVTLQANLDSATYAFGTRFVPDVIPLLIGINDIVSDGQTNAQLAVRYAALLADIKSKMPQAKVIAMDLLQYSASAPITAQVLDWNANYLPGVIATAVSGGQNVIADHTFAGMTLAKSDGLHPNASEGPAMAAAIYPQYCGWVGTTP